MASRTLEFELIVMRYRQRIFAQALRVLGNREDAEEATQDVLMNVYDALADFRNEANITTWLYRITMIACGRMRRRQALTGTSLEDLGLDISDPEQDLEASYTRKDLHAYVTGLLSRLPVQQAAALSLFYYEGSPIEEISSILNVEPNTVASYLHRARRKLHHVITKTLQEA